MIDILITASVGSLFTLAGFGLKFCFDYYYLKSPHIFTEVTIKGDLTSPPSNGYRKYSYKVICEFYNHSKNEAYGFELTKCVIDGAFKLSEKPQNLSKNPLTDTVPLILELAYEVILPILPGTEAKNSTGRLDELVKRYLLEISFKNALGKEYTKVFEGEMTTKNNDRIFNFGW